MLAMSLGKDIKEEDIARIDQMTSSERLAALQSREGMRYWPYVLLCGAWNRQDCLNPAFIKAAYHILFFPEKVYGGDRLLYESVQVGVLTVLQSPDIPMTVPWQESYCNKDLFLNFLLTLLRNSEDTSVSGYLLAVFALSRIMLADQTTCVAKDLPFEVSRAFVRLFKSESGMKGLLPEQRLFIALILELFTALFSHGSMMPPPSAEKLRLTYVPFIIACIRSAEQQPENSILRDKALIFLNELQQMLPDQSDSRVMRESGVISVVTQLLPTAGVKTFALVLRFLARCALDKATRKLLPLTPLILERITNIWKDPKSSSSTWQATLQALQGLIHENPKNFLLFVKEHQGSNCLESLRQEALRREVEDLEEVFQFFGVIIMIDKEGILKEEAAWMIGIMKGMLESKRLTEKPMRDCVTECLRHYGLRAMKPRIDALMNVIFTEKNTPAAIDAMKEMVKIQESDANAICDWYLRISNQQNKIAYNLGTNVHRGEGLRWMLRLFLLTAQDIKAGIWYPEGTRRIVDDLEIFTDYFKLFRGESLEIFLEELASYCSTPELRQIHAPFFKKFFVINFFTVFLSLRKKKFKEDKLMYLVFRLLKDLLTDNPEVAAEYNAEGCRLLIGDFVKSRNPEVASLASHIRDSLEAAPIAKFKPSNIIANKDDIGNMLNLFSSMKLRLRTC